MVTKVRIDKIQTVNRKSLFMPLQFREDGANEILIHKLRIIKKYSTPETTTSVLYAPNGDTEAKR